MRRRVVPSSSPVPSVVSWASDDAFTSRSHGLVFSHIRRAKTKALSRNIRPGWLDVGIVALYVATWTSSSVCGIRSTRRKATESKQSKQRQEPLDMVQPCGTGVMDNFTLTTDHCNKRTGSPVRHNHIIWIGPKLDHMPPNPALFGGSCYKCCVVHPIALSCFVQVLASSLCR